MSNTCFQRMTILITGTESLEMTSCFLPPMGLHLLWAEEHPHGPITTALFSSPVTLTGTNGIRWDHLGGSEGRKLSSFALSLRLTKFSKAQRTWRQLVPGG